MSIELDEKHQEIADEARERICACIAGEAVAASIDVSRKQDSFAQ